jgi:hypothetical protein
MPELNPVDIEQPSSLQTLLNGVTHVPDILRDTMTDAVEQSAQRAALQTAEFLTQSAHAYFQEFLDKKATIDNIDDTLNQLIEHYHAEKSLLTKWAQWFGEMSWFETIGYGVTSVAVSAMIGATFNMAALFGLIAIGLYYATSTLLIEHYLITTERDQQLIQGIHAMKTNLADLINQLTELAGRVHTIQCELFQKNRQTTEELDVFKNTVLEMSTHIHTLQETIHALNQARALLMEDNIRIIEERNLINRQLETANETLIQQANQLNDIHLRLEETNASFLNRNNDIINLRENLNTRINDLAELHKLYQIELTRLQSETKRTLHPQTLDTTPTAEETNQRVQRSYEMIERAKEYLRNKNSTQMESREYPGNPFGL